MIEMHLRGRMYMRFPLLSFNYQLSWMLLLRKVNRLPLFFMFHLQKLMRHEHLLQFGLNDLGIQMQLPLKDHSYVRVPILFVFGYLPIFSFPYVYHSAPLLSKSTICAYLEHFNKHTSSKGNKHLAF